MMTKVNKFYLGSIYSFTGKIILGHRPYSLKQRVSSGMGAMDHDDPIQYQQATKNNQVIRLSSLTDTINPDVHQHVPGVLISPYSKIWEITPYW